MNIDSLLDAGYVPTPLIRVGIRRQLAIRLTEIAQPSLAALYNYKTEFAQTLREKPIAVETDTANTQHYEVGTGVLSACLGKRMKYSSCLYETGKETLDEAEVKMLESYTVKAGLVDGMDILDLGCGWGSASLFFAEKFPKSNITALSNSRTQKVYIDSQAVKSGFTNLNVVTGNVALHEFTENSFDRIISIEMFEHMKNYELLIAKCSRWLRLDGKLFVHIFAHATTPYEFKNEDGWMAEHFFSGGTMPDVNLLLYFQRDMAIEKQWWLNGKTYARTCEDWFKLLCKNKKEIWPHLEETYGRQDALMWFHRWQIFYLACAELFAYNGGDTWGVAHYLFQNSKKR